MTLGVFEKDGGRDEIEVGHEHVLKCGYQYLSPLLDEEVEMNDYGEGLLVLVGSMGNAIASSHRERWVLKKQRTLKIVGGEGRALIIVRCTNRSRSSYTKQ